jgi:hypothetical protein
LQKQPSIVPQIGELNDVNSAPQVVEPICNLSNQAKGQEQQAWPVHREPQEPCGAEPFADCVFHPFTEINDIGEQHANQEVSMGTASQEIDHNRLTWFFWLRSLYAASIQSCPCADLRLAERRVLQCFI